MGRSGAEALGGSISLRTSIERQPLRPISAHLEEIIEVSEAIFFKLADEDREEVVRRQGTNPNEIALHEEFIGRQVISFIQCLTKDPTSLVSISTNQNNGSAVAQFDWHK